MNDYYNRFNASKNYKKHMFRSGKGLQSAELNEIQDNIKHELNQVSEAIFGDGSLLKGGEVRIHGGQMSITQCTVYAKGFTHQIGLTTLDIPQNGTTIVGLAIKETEITELQDPALRDPAIGTRNFNEPGAGRLKVDARWVLESDKEVSEYFYPIYTFIDDNLQPVTKVAPELEGARTMIARYDNASSGSYVISGLELAYDSDEEANQRHRFTVSAGSCHVEGYEVEFQYAKNLFIPFSNDTKSISAEPHTFEANGVYPTRKGPIASIVQILGIKKVTKNISHGNFLGAKDTLPNTPIVSVISVRQGSTVFIEGVDYIVSGDEIDWSLSGAEPAPGSTYTVIYQYTSSTVTGDITTDRSGVNITGLATGTLFYISYTYYIPRIDRVLLTKEGNFKILTGVPDDVNPKAPKHTNLLSLGTVKVLKGKVPEVNLDYFRAFKMSDIQSLLDDIIEVKYNIARLALKEDINQMDPSTVKKNTFVDPFIDDDMRDQGKTQNAFISSKTLLANTEWDVQTIYEGNAITLPYKDSVYIQNSAYSKVRKINEYQHEGAPSSSMTISPSSYRWVESVTYRTVVGSGSSFSTDYNLGRVATVPNISLTVNGGVYNANEQVEVYFDNKLVTTLTANSTGMIVNQSFQIPNNTTSGSKAVTFKGKVSEAASTVIFTSIPLIREFVTVVAPPPPPPPRIWWNSDPVAQTFTPTKDLFIGSVDIQVKNLPSEYIEVGISETTVGLPDKNRIIISKRLRTEDLNTTSWSNFKFDEPVYLIENTEYAIIISTPDAISTVAVSELGQYDLNNKRWITNQSYNTGVLLNSSNMSTWTPIQKEDLTFRLNQAIFEAEHTTLFRRTTVEAVTDLMLLADVDVYPDTVTQFEAILRSRNNQTVILAPNSPVTIAEYTGGIDIRAVLSSSQSEFSPVVDGSVQLASGLIKFPSSYISRQFDVDGEEIRVYIEMFEPSSTSVKVFYESAPDIYTELTRDMSTAVNIGNGFVDLKFGKQGLTVTNTRVKIVLDTSDSELRPMVRNLRAFIV